MGDHKAIVQMSVSLARDTPYVLVEVRVLEKVRGKAAVRNANLAVRAHSKLTRPDCFPIDSIEMVDWYYQDPDPVMNRALGGPRRSPRQSVTIRPLQGKDQTRFFSFQGDIALIIRIAQELARRCGPLAAFATCDGIPAFFLPGGESPIWREPWL
jgi:hypothetical protein